jgi:CRISPR-associated endonuclease/helicase Cas3
MAHVDLLFPVLGTTLPIDHNYLLYGALSKLVPRFHDPNGNLRFTAINGQRGAPGQLGLFDKSRLRCRLNHDAIADVLPLAGKSLQVGDHRIRLGVPQVAALIPATTLIARIVTFKNADTPEHFLEHSRQLLKEMNINGEPGIPLIQAGPRQGEPRRMIVRIKGKRVIGYALRVEGLTAEESIKLQEEGLGGRARMGCGFFVAMKEDYQ